MLFDTHVHLNDKRYNSDRESVINSAIEAGVSYMLNASYDERSISQTLSLSRKYPFIYAAVGIHPHYVKDVKDEDENILDIIEKEIKENSDTKLLVESVKKLILNKESS